MTRYLLCKAWEGFADRLQYLSYAIDVALHFNRILCVDWRDGIWTDAHEGFDDYFVLVGVPYISSVDAIPQGLAVHPRLWAGQLGAKIDETIYSIKEKVVIDPAQRNHHEGLWVFPGIGFRSYDFVQLSQHLRFAPVTSAEITRRLALLPDDLPVIHLRGTDRIAQSDPLKRLRKKTSRALVVSDDSRLIARWLDLAPDSVIATAPRDRIDSGEIGLHRASPTFLSAQGLKKRDLNLQLLTDFMTISRAKVAYSNNSASLFFSMARLLGACGGATRMFEAPAAPIELASNYAGYSFFLRPNLGDTAVWRENSPGSTR